MRKLTLYTLFLFILFFQCCGRERWEGRILTKDGVVIIENRGSGLWRDKTSEKITFREDLSIGVEEGEEYLMFRAFLRVAVDSKLNIYILDALNQRLLKFDKEGNFIWKAGRKGQGPGEFQWPNNIAITIDEDVVVIDSPFIHFFRNDGIFQHVLKVRESIRGIQFLSDNKLFVNTVTKGQPGIAAEFLSSEGKLLGKFPDEYRYGPKISPNLGASIGGGFFQLYGNKIFLSIPDRYEIREYDLAGRVLRKITRNIKLNLPNIKVSFGGRGVSVFPSDNSGPCFIYKRKILINELELVEKINENKYRSEKFLDFFNEKRQFLGSYKLENQLTLSTIDHQSYFYFVQFDPFPKVIRAKLKIE